MPLVPLSHLPQPPAPEPPPMVRHVGREDVLWNRPVFKAPPLQLSLSHQDVQALAEELRRIGLHSR